MALLVARHGSRIERAEALRAPELLNLLLAVDALRRPARFEQLLRACAVDWSARIGRPATGYEPAEYLRAALEVVRGVQAAALAERVARKDLPKRLRRVRLKTLQQWRASRAPTIRRNASSRKRCPTAARRARHHNR